MTCCIHAGYDDSGFHEYCCECFTYAERIENMIEDSLDKFYDSHVQQATETIIAVMKEEGVL